MTGTALTGELRELLAGADYDLDGATWELCKQGNNNRVFCITAGQKRFIVKSYYRDRADARDRLNSEYSFLEYAVASGVRCVPRPLACLRDTSVGIYEYVDGDRFSARAVAATHVDQALRFFDGLNRSRASSPARALPRASESCFSIREHLDLVEGRVRKLCGIQPANAVDAEARDFVDALHRHWTAIRTTAERSAAELCLDVGRVLTPQERCVSPSDFGFHNVVVRPSGELCFVDFEYAGWDDPAKTVCDFFCQPAFPVPEDFLPGFPESVAAILETGTGIVDRARLLMPVYRIKWTCIMLNDFLPDSAGRRRFSRPELDEQERKTVQLQKARQYSRVA